MPNITSLGTGSGIDLQSLLDNLITAEGEAPRARLSTQKTSVEAKISAVGSLKSTLTSFQTSMSSLSLLSAYQPRTAVSASTSQFTAAASSTAAPGVYTVDVNALAVSHKLISDTNYTSATMDVGSGTLTIGQGAVGSAITRNTFALTSTDVGSGTLTISTGTDSFIVTISSGAKTVQDIVDGINNHTSNVGLTASTVTVAGGVQIKVAVDSPDSNTAFTMTSDDDDLDDTDTSGLSQLIYANTGTSNMSAVSYTGGSFVVTVASTAATVGDVVNAINDHTSNTGVSAATLTSDAGVKMILTSNNTGTAYKISVQADDDDLDDLDASGLSELIYGDGVTTTGFTEQTAAADAVIVVDGQTLTSSSNTVTGALTGVTLSLLETTTDAKNLTIGQDTASATANVTSFVNAYNVMMLTFNALTSFDSDTGLTGELFGDATINTLLRQVRNEIGTTVTGISGTYATFADIGITTASTGLLQINTDTLSSRLTSDFDNVGEIFAATDGVAKSLDSLFDDYTESVSGFLDERTTGLVDSLALVIKQQARVEINLEKLEARLVAKFTAMDILVQQLRSTSSFLTEQLDNLPGVYTKPS